MIKRRLIESTQALNQTFKIKDLRYLRYFIGLEITSKKWIMVNQRKYALKLLTDTSLLAYKLALTHIDNHMQNCLLLGVFLSQIFKLTED